MKKRLYILKHSYPQKVKIVCDDSNFNKEYSYDCYEEFENEIDYLLYLSNKKGYKVYLFLIPHINRMLVFDSVFSFYSQSGYVLLDFVDIKFYDYDENKNRNIFDDMFQYYLDLSNSIENKYNDLLVALNLKTNKNFVNAGESLLRFLIKDAVFDKGDTLEICQNLSKNFLTNKKLADLVVKKYKFESFVKTMNKPLSEEHDKTKRNKIIADCVKAFLYAIFIVSQNIEDLKQIVRDFIFSTEDFVCNQQNIWEKYKTLSDNLLENFNSKIASEITFKQIEKIINAKFDYKMQMFYSLLEDFGFQFTKFDFKNKIAYFKKLIF